MVLFVPGAAICSGVVGTLRLPDSSSWAPRKIEVSYMPKPAEHKEDSIKKLTNIWQKEQLINSH